MKLEQNWPLFDLDELISHVKSDNVEVTITMEPDRAEISIAPWRPYRPICPMAGEGLEG